MADPLSIAAGVAGLLSLAIQTTKGLVEFYIAYKDQYPEVARTTEKIESLLRTFQFLDATLQSRKFRADERQLIDQVETSIKQCSDLISDLGDELQNFQKSPPGNFKSTIKAVGRRVAYPFKQSTLQKLDEDVGDIRNDLALALEVLQLQDHKSAQDDIAEVRSILEVVRAAQISSTIRDWLKAPDISVNHNAACSKRHPGTGVWLVKSPIFFTWLTQENTFLWLHGFAGCGKSVLCSTAIQYAFRQKHSDPNTGIAFFYFTFSDESKRSESDMLRALLLQLAGQLSDGATVLARLHESYKTVLIEYLRLLIQKFSQVYILIDALDESPRFEERDQVLAAVEAMRQWNLPGLHLLVTSRDEVDIRESLNPVKDEEVLMRGAEIDRDISNFISGHLRSALPKWQKYHDQIQQALSERAHGVFRWVECQFEALKRCPRSERHLNQCLETLPRNLDSTYERMLCSIDDESAEEARRILTLLCFSARPLTVSELIDGIAVKIDDPVGLDHQSRLEDAESLHEICPGLIHFDFENDTSKAGKSNGREDGVPTVRIAHFSVQEYLESSRIRESKAASYALSSAVAHAEIAQICCAYLLDPGLSEELVDVRKLKQFPLARFAAMFWVHHYKSATCEVPQLKALVLRIFTEQHQSFNNWQVLTNIDSPWQPERDFNRNLAKPSASPEYFASLIGLDWVLQALFTIKREDGRDIVDLVNSKGGYYGNALQAAASGGHEKVVQMLLDAAANINTRGGFCNDALQAASMMGHEKVVQMLIGAGADVNAQGRVLGNALQAASYYNHEKVVQMLLDGGAEIDAEGGEYGNALQAASIQGHEKVVQMLLDAGADINAQVGRYGDALRAASAGVHEKIIKLLLDAGAEINPEPKHYGTALQVASLEGNEKLVQMLLDAGADIDAQGGYYGNALHAASLNGHVRVVRVLLDAGAEINAKGGYCGTALRAASLHGRTEVEQMLIEAGAEEGDDVDIL